jgi:RNA polymerase-interacting CarD/CdnL/TRCF family regulator
MTIMIPTENVDVVGLREVVPSVEIPRVLDILKERQVILDSQTWNRRYREYMDKIHTGSIFSIAEVLRDLQILKMEKNLSCKGYQRIRCTDGDKKDLRTLNQCCSKDGIITHSPLTLSPQPLR